MAEIRLRIAQMGQDDEQKNIVLLVDSRDRQLPIVIGPCEAAAIARRFIPAETLPAERRPHSHDLLSNLIQQLGAKVERVVIDDLWNRTYYATLHLRRVARPFGPPSRPGTGLGTEQAVTVDARPSDAVALALRSEAPIYASEDVMRKAGEPEQAEEPPPDVPDLGLP